LSITSGVTNTWTVAYGDYSGLSYSYGLEVKDDNTILVGGSSIYELNITASTFNLVFNLVYPDSFVIGDFIYNPYTNRIILLAYGQDFSTYEITEMYMNGTVYARYQFTYDFGTYVQEGNTYDKAPESLIVNNNNLYIVTGNERDIYQINLSTGAPTYVQSITGGLANLSSGFGAPNQCNNVSLAPSATITPTPTNSNTPTVTPTSTVTPTNSVTPTSTVTPTNSVTPTNTPAAIVSSNLLLHYNTFNTSSYNGSGATITDLSGNGRNGTIEGSPTWTTNYFTFVDDYITTTNLSSAITSANETHSVELWVYPTNNGVLVQYNNSTSPSTSYHHSSIEIVGGNLEVGLWNGSVVGSTGNIGAVSFNQWHQIVLTYNGSVCKGYIDGVFKGSVNVLWDSPMNYSQPFYMNFGYRDATSQGDGTDFDGRFGIMRVYNSALTDAQVLSNYNSTLPTVI
jgi:hypothetical protein